MREIIKKVRIKSREITLTYKIPHPPKNPSGEGSEGEFFTVLKWWRRGESNPRPKVFRQI